MASKEVKLKITSAIAVDGKIVKRGETVVLAEAAAKNLLDRGRAELAEASDDTSEFAKMKVKELKEYALELDIDGADGMNKAELVAAIEAALAE